MVHYIKEGDIFQIEGINSYAHCCNCCGAMGKGIALQFRQRFPRMYTEYHKLCKQGKFLPGDVYTYRDGKETVFNLGTQESWKTKATLANVETALIQMMKIAETLQISSIALPTIGAGLGGLDWGEVKSIINKISVNNPRTELYVVENYSSKT